MRVRALTRPLTLVLLPGLDGTGDLMRWFLAALPPTIEPMVMTLPDGTDGSYDALAAHVARRLPRKRPFVLLGESFSGPLALRLAARRPKGLVAVVLVATFVVQPIDWLMPAARHFAHESMFSLPMPSLAWRWLLLDNLPPADVVDVTMQTLRRANPAAMAARARAALGVDASADLRACPVPLLYLGGRRDRLISPHAGERLRRLRPDLTVEMLDAPHFVLQCAPDAAAQAITGFLDRQVP